MKFAELVAGDTRSNLESNELARETRRMCQGIRTYQNFISFALVSVVGGAYVLSLWGRTDSKALLIWYLTFSSLTIVRAFVYESVRKSLPTATPADLLRNEANLLLTGGIVSVVLGMSYWVVGVPGDERTVLAITVLTCVYATGATINAATQLPHLLVYLAAILGQAILFWAGFANRTDYAMALLLFCLCVLLYTFAFRNRALIVESVKMRLESKAHNESLVENRTLVEAALESALEANRSKSHFIATVSHDMAQPIHALTYLLESLKSSVGNDGVHADIVAKIGASVGLIERQFEGFVDLARYDVNDLDMQRDHFDLTALCQMLVENVEANAAANDVEINLSAEVAVVETDSVLIGRLLNNLLDNAIKFGAGGLVHLRLRAGEKWVVVEVEDAGVGIRQQDLPKIFGDFVQIKSASPGAATGAGLGLSIVRRIADALGVEVYVQSKLSKGTTFTLLVPREPSLLMSGDSDRPVVAGVSIREIGSGEATLAVPRVNLHGKVILLVDDEPSSVKALAGYIGDLGGFSLCAATVDETLTLVGRNAVDLAIVDDLLDSAPAGLSLCMTLAGQIGEDRVVMVTANDSKRRRREIEEAGFSVYSKPLKVPRLQAILSARLGIGLT